MSTIKFFIAALMLSASSMVMAQKPSDVKEQCKKPTPEQCMEMQWQRVSKKLMLSDKESEKVKPIYADYLKELSEVCPCCKKGEKCDKGEKAEKGKRPTEAEVKEKMKAKFAASRKRIDIQEKYFDKFSKELNAYQAKYLINSPKKMKAGKKKVNKFPKGQRFPRMERGKFPAMPQQQK